MRRGKRQITKEISLPNQENIRKLGEKETYKYLEILEADTIKQVDTKEKSFKRISLGVRENFAKPNSLAGISSKR